MCLRGIVLDARRLDYAIGEGVSDDAVPRDRCKLSGQGGSLHLPSRGGGAKSLVTAGLFTANLTSSSSLSLVPYTDFLELST